MGASHMREQFEYQFVEEYVRVLGEGARELAAHALAANSPVVSMSWWAWRASRDTVVLGLPIDCSGGLYRLALEDCKNCIEAQGLKVKP